jgi:hypothetical protein
MLVSVKKNSTGTWDVNAAKGPMLDQLLARVEGIVLTNCIFDDDMVIGNAQSCWGAELVADFMYLRELGIGRVFCHARDGELEHRDCHNFTMGRSSAMRVQILNDDVFVSA